MSIEMSKKSMLLFRQFLLYSVKSNVNAKEKVVFKQCVAFKPTAEADTIVLRSIIE